MSRPPPFGQAVVHLKSPCLVCDQVDYDNDCFKGCKSIKAYLDSTKRDTRFETEKTMTFPAPEASIASPKLPVAATQELTCKNHPDRPWHKNTGLCLECVQERARGSAKARMSKKEAKAGERAAVAPISRQEDLPPPAAVVTSGSSIQPIPTESVPFVDLCAKASAPAPVVVVDFTGREDLLEWLKKDAHNSVRTVEEQLIWLAKRKSAGF